MTKPRSIENFMTEYPTIASTRTTVTEAAEFMQKCKIRHLPVIEKGVVIGIVSDRDLKQAELLADAMSLVVADVMTAKPYCVKIGTPLAEVAREMANQKIGSAVVLNGLSQVVGIFTTTDAMRILAEMLDSDPSPRFRLMKVEEVTEANYAS